MKSLAALIAWIVCVLLLHTPAKGKRTEVKRTEAFLQQMWKCTPGKSSIRQTEKSWKSNIKPNCIMSLFEPQIIAVAVSHE